MNKTFTLYFCLCLFFFNANRVMAFIPHEMPNNSLDIGEFVVPSTPSIPPPQINSWAANQTMLKLWQPKAKGQFMMFPPSCLEADSLELVAFYNATGGDNWTNNSGWLVDDVEDWFGVSVSADGCSVKVLEMFTGLNTGNNLVGNIPNFDLPNLETLNLKRNQLTGGIPNFDLPNLEVLWLNTNLLTGEIPDFNLPNLEVLSLMNTGLTGEIPNFDLPNLEALSLQINGLTGNLPNFNLPNLEYLGLHDNELTGNLPNFDLPNLEIVYLNNNALAGEIPNFDLPNIKILWLYNNGFTGEIPNFDLPNLEILLLRNNGLAGEIPNFDLPNLENLNLSENGLTGEIPNFDFPNLHSLNLNNNALTGEIPNFSLPNLYYIRLNNNGLTGEIPNFDLPILINLNLSENGLTGEIPNFGLPNLISLNLSKNGLTGEIPNFNLPDLENLYLSDNALTFDGLVPHVQNYNTNTNFTNLYYAPQSTIFLHQSDNTLYVEVGGLSNNHYAWFKDGTEFTTISGDSSLVLTESGNYYVQVTNDIVTNPDESTQNLILISEELFITVLPPNDKCSTPISLIPLTIQEYGPYSNTDAAIEASDPLPNCFEDNTLNNTVWFTFTGDGNTYNLSTTDCSGSSTAMSNTQMAIFEGGDCTNLTEIDCSEDIAVGTDLFSGIVLPTTSGTEYFLMVDGNGGDVGDFCVDVTLAETCSPDSNGTIYVTTTEDNGDNDNPTFGSLRAAIICANDTEGANTIEFDLGTEPSYIIQVPIALPILTDSHTTIDGAYTGDTDTGYIELWDGNHQGGGVQFGIAMEGDSCELYGFHIHSFYDYGIRIDNCTGCKVGAEGKGNILNANGSTLSNAISNTDSGIFIRNNSINTEVKYNKIGTDIGGNNAVFNRNGIRIIESIGTVIENNVVSGNQTVGVYLTSESNNTIIKNNKIGTNDLGINSVIFQDVDNNLTIHQWTGVYIANSTGVVVDDNLISGNRFHGIHILENSQNTIIKNNTIGLNESKDSPLHNRNGIIIAPSTETSIEDNLISGNSKWGIFLDSLVENTVIEGNKIGTDELGLADLGNGEYGINISNHSTTNTSIGNILGTGSNTIAYNPIGIFVNNNASNTYTIHQNSIYCNTDAGITTSLISPPIITQTTSTNILGTANSENIIEVFLHDTTGCLSLPCQGKTYLGTAIADTNGDWSLNSFTETITAGQEVVATATNSNHTSKFSDCKIICPEYELNIEGDDIFCQGSSATLQIGDDPTFTNYQWSNGSSDPSIDVTEEGIYTVTVTDGNDCSATASTEVNMIPIPSAYWDADIVDCNCLTADSLELVNFYNVLDGNNWLNTLANNQKWLEGNIVDWFGVTLSEDGCDVSSLILKSDSLKGNIPDLQLSNLVTLDLYKNNLLGTIPEFTELTKLRTLHLHRNDLSGTIPSFVELTELESLQLNFNDLSGIIPEFTELTKLKILNLHQNTLEGTIPSFSELTELEELRLNHCDSLKGTIPEFTELTKLKRLHLHQNDLSGTIPDFTSLDSLISLRLNHNKFTFEGLEPNVNYYNSNVDFNVFSYTSQNTIPLYQAENTDTLYVEAGGDLNKNTYYWYKNNVLDSTIVGNKTHTVTESANYRVEVTNNIVTNPSINEQNLILVSEELFITTTTCSPDPNGNIYVTTLSDNGDNNNPTVGSLRAAIICANETAEANQIYIDTEAISTSAPYLIQPIAELPALTDAETTIDFAYAGNTSTGYVELDGSLIDESVETDAKGLTLQGDNSEIYGFYIHSFPDDGVFVDGCDGCKIGSPEKGNIISGNGGDGVFITGNITMNTTLQNNLIGLNSNDEAMGNTTNGVVVSSFASNTTIESNNVISGNGHSGIWITDFADNTIVRGNKIGTNTDGTASLGNGHDGIAVENNASNTTIGGSTNTDRNVISGNTASGILLGSGANNASIDNNFIGTDFEGMEALPNAGGGIYIEGASSTSIGLSAENLISGNGDSGITLQENASNITIEFNKIGTNINGTTAIPNTLYGIDAGVTDGLVFIGSNLVSGNTLDGIHLGAGAEFIEIAFNKIGTDLNGTAPLGNGESGIEVKDSDVIEIFDNTIAYNLIGVEITGSSDSYGIHLNSIYCNSTSGIEINTSSVETDAPVIEYSNLNAISGTATANATIEIFVHDDTNCNEVPCQGKFVLGTATADESGYWTLNTNSLTIGEITVATATFNNNTSEFSACSQVCPDELFTFTASCPDENGQSIITIFPINPDDTYIVTVGDVDLDENVLAFQAGSDVIVTLTSTTTDCSSFALIEVPTEIPTLDLDNNVSQVVLCGEGSIILAPTGLGEGGTYHYYLDSNGTIPANPASGDVWANSEIVGQRIIYIIGTTSNGCESAPMAVSTYHYELISVDNVQTTCNDADNSYIVTFTISGGNDAYTVDGVSAPNNYTSGAISQNESYSFVIDDNPLIPSCEPLTISGLAPDCISGLIALDDFGATEVGISVNVDVLANDIGCNLSIGGILVSPSCGEIISINPETGEITYTPDVETTCNIDTFVYEVIDCNGETAQATVTIFIAQQNTLEVEIQRDCKGAEETGTYRLDIAIIDGVPPFTISGSINETLPTYEETYVIITDGEPYQITVIDADGNEFFREGGGIPCTKFGSCLDSILINGVLCPPNNPTVVLSALTSASVEVPIFEFSYEWSTGETTQSIEVAESGAYSVTVLNTDGCHGVGLVEVIEDCSINCDPITFDSSTIALNGTATVDEDNNCIVLTPGLVQEEIGSIWHTQKVNLAESFTMTAMLETGVDGSDGLTFVLHNDALGLEAIGAHGEGLGYGSNIGEGENNLALVQPSIAIEVDTHLNSDKDDPNFNHIAVNENGSTISVNTPVEIPHFGEGIAYELEVVWNPSTLELSYYFNGDFKGVYEKDLVTEIFGGQTTAYWGFTAATGGSVNSHQVCNAQLTNCATELTAINDNYTTSFNTPLTFTPLENDLGDCLEIAGIIISGNNITLNQTGNTLTYTPAIDFIGTIDFEYIISDCFGETDTALVTISVDNEGINLPPIAMDDNLITNINEPIGIGVLANDTDPEGEELTIVSIISDPINGTTTIDGNAVVYTPNPNFIGIDSFEYVVCDIGGLCDIGLVIIQVIGQGESIEAVNDTVYLWTVSDVPPFTVSFNILENDLGEGIELRNVFYNASIDVGEDLTFETGGDVFFQPTMGTEEAGVIQYEIIDANGQTALADLVLVIDAITEEVDSDSSLVASILGECVPFENATVTGVTTAYTKIDAFQLDFAADIIEVDVSELPFSEGILLTTGSALNGIFSPNTVGSLGTDNETTGDIDLTNDGEQTFDACTLEFDFTAISESISFPYWFGSEEYEVGSYPDRMAIFISGGEFTVPLNIATLPDGTSIGVETVNQDTNNEHFQWNEYGTLPQYDGFTTQLEAIAKNLTIGETYHIKIVIADVGDTEYDSGLFIKANMSVEDLDLEVSNDVQINQGESTELSVEVLNTTSNVVYEWSPSETLDDANSTTPMATPTETTTYYVTATLGNCEFMDSVLVTVEAIPCEGLSAGILPDFDEYVCFGENVGGDISLITEGFELRAGDVLGYVLQDVEETTLAYSSTNANFGFADFTNPQYNTEYFVSAVVGTDDGNGNVNFEGECVFYSDSVSVVFLEDIILTTHILCNDNDSFSVEISAIGGLPEYLPDTELYTVESTGETFAIGGDIEVGSFNNGTVIEIGVIDDSGCTSIVPVEHNSLAILVGGTEVTNGSWEIEVGESVELTAIADDGTTFEWTPSETLENSNTSNPTASPTETTTYTVTATVNETCELITTVTIIVIDPCAGLSAGTLPTIEPYVCFGNKFGGTDSFIAEGSSLKEGYVLGYVLQDAEGMTLAYKSTDANFAFGDFTNPQYNTEYFVSAVVGADDGSGNVDFAEEGCIFYSESVSVVFLKQIILTTNILCDNNEAFFVEVSATGGLPDYLPSTELYTVEASGQTFAIGGDVEVGPFDSDELANIEVADGNDCIETVLIENYLLSILVQEINLTNDTLIISEGESISLDGIVTGTEPSTIIDYTWSIEESVITQIPTLNTTPDTSAVYTLMVEIAGNCTLTADITVLVLPSAQDCLDAIVVCDTEPIYYNSDGEGIEEINGLDEEGCLGAGGEYHSTWFRLQIDAATNPDELLMFTISPNDGKEDYDFALYKSSDCSTLGIPLRSTSAQPSDESADTGLRLGVTDTCENLAIDDGFLKPLVVNGGEVYYLLVNNFAGNLQGFKLEWTGNVVFNCIPPPECSAMGGTLTLNQDDYCDESNIELTWSDKNTELSTKILYLAADQNTIVPIYNIGTFCMVGLNYESGIIPNDYTTIEEIQTAIDSGSCMALSTIDCFNVSEMPDIPELMSKECNNDILHINLDVLEDATIRWFAGDTLFVEGNNVPIEVAGTYYVTQTLNDCESNVFEVIVSETDLVCLNNCPENLIENFSFEEFDVCPEFGGDIREADFWRSPLGTATKADYFNECNGVPNSYNVPQNLFGIQSTILPEEMAYAGITAYNHLDNDITKRQFLQTELTNTLIEGQTYCVSMQVSLAESSQYAINNLGIYFSDNRINSIDIEGVLNPQIQHPPFLTDTENWMEIQGTFKATADLKHLIIGNFDPNNGTVLVNENGNGQAYYYIDMIDIRPINKIEGFSVFNQNNEELEVIDNTVVICPDDIITMEAVVSSTNYSCDLGWGNSVDDLVSQTSFTVSGLETDTVYQFWVSNGFCDIADSLVVVLGEESGENGECVFSVCSMAEQLMNTLQDVRVDLPYSRAEIEVQSTDLEDLVKYELSQLAENINGFNANLLENFEVNAAMSSLQTSCDPAYIQVSPNSIIYDNSNLSEYAYTGEDELTYTITFPGCEPVTQTLTVNIQCPVFVSNGFTSDCHTVSFKLSNPLMIAYSSDTIDLEEANAIGLSYQYRIEGINNDWQSANNEEMELSPDASYTVFMRLVQPNTSNPIFHGSNANQCGEIMSSSSLNAIDVEIVKNCLEEGKIELFAKVEEGYTYSFEWSTGETTQQIEVEAPFEKAYWVRVVRSDDCEGIDTVSDLNPFELTLEDHDPRRCLARISIKGGIPDQIILDNEEVSKDDCFWDEDSNTYKCNLILPVTYEETIALAVSDDVGNCTSRLELDACNPRIKVIKPNPSRGAFTIELTGIPKGMPLHYNVYSRDHRLVLSSDKLAKDYDESLKNWRTVGINLEENFYSGVYYVQFIIGDGEFILMDKLIKIE